MTKYFALACLLLCQPLRAGDFSAERAQVLALGGLHSAPAMRAEGGGAVTAVPGEIKTIYYDALECNGKPTRVFAYLGLPSGASPSRKVPAVVLVHGGGGTAFKEWVELWNERGYAAISIAVEGQTDVRVPGQRAWKRHERGGPARSGIYGDSDKPLADQWMYHAVADTILANSLLRSLPEVDEEKVGLMGISWGGIITSTVIGIDDRFAFAIPTYGCGSLHNAANHYGPALCDNELYEQVWDPMVRMDRARMPVLWLSWPGDQHFPLDLQAACYRAAPGRRMVSLIPGMGHGHAAGWRPPDSYAFADSVVKEGTPWCRETNASLKEGAFSVTFASSKTMENATLVWTRDTGITGDRNWTVSPAIIERSADDAWTITASLPDGATAWFVNARSGDLTVSSDFQQAE